jgi:hypothetical protein
MGPVFEWFGSHFFTIQKPDPKIVRKINIQKPDRPVFGR